MLHREMRRGLILGLCLVWIAAFTGANGVAAPTMRCQRAHMPCCPPAGHGDHQCSAVRCQPQIFQKSEAPLATHPPFRDASSCLPASRRAAAPPRKLVPGSSFSVFRLKDDLRI